MTEAKELSRESVIEKLNEGKAYLTFSGVQNVPGSNIQKLQNGEIGQAEFVQQLPVEAPYSFKEDSGNAITVTMKDNVFPEMQEEPEILSRLSSKVLSQLMDDYNLLIKESPSLTEAPFIQEEIKQISSETGCTSCAKKKYIIKWLKYAEQHGDTEKLIGLFDKLSRNKYKVKTPKRPPQPPQNRTQPQQQQQRQAGLQQTIMDKLPVMRVSAEFTKRRGEILQNIAEIVSNEENILKRTSSMDACMDCVRKHLATAGTFFDESKGGYPIHRWRGIGELVHGEYESVGRYPELAMRIRAERLVVMADPEYVPDINGLIQLACDKEEQDEK